MNIDIMSLSNAMQRDAEFIPLLTQEEENKLINEEIPEELALLPIRNNVLFPGVVIPISASRDKSIKLLNDACNGNKIIGVVAQINSQVDDPTEKEIYKVGVVAKIIRLLKLPDGNVTVILQGMRRFEWEKINQTEPYFTASVKKKDDSLLTKKEEPEFEAIIESIRDISIQIVEENPMLPSEAVIALKNIESPSFLVNFVSFNMNIGIDTKQKLLSISKLKIRAIETLKLLNVEYQKLSLKNDIQSKVKNDLDQQQKEYFLNQQIKIIQEELGGVSFEEETEEFKQRAKDKKWNKETEEKFNKELTRLQRMNRQMPEYNIQRNYIEFMLDLPWNKASKDKYDLVKAEKVLNNDHFGLEDIKERILEYLAVLKLKNNMKSPILCLYGPPGVGKTSLGKSIADAMNRKYVRMSLGGLHDESEIRGHRRTYIGAMPGRILQLLKKAGTSNPVFVLDEIDKMTTSMNGDPSSAMLEVLDPEQNNEFYDNFLEQGYDLSNVMFIATANNINTIPTPLRDRMELIQVTGYTVEEKIAIAHNHLIPKQIEEHGIKKIDINLSKPIIEKIITGYTRESGVRNLEKKIAKVIRRVAKEVVMKNEYEKNINEISLSKILGPARMPDKYENNNIPGVVTGLAWTSVGGDILFIESILTKGKGTLTITGNIGNVMKESSTIALQFIKSNYEKLGIKPELFDTNNIHIHVPEGAVPKDGPSAGVAMLTSLVSILTKRKIKSKLAMTGEITLRGKVLPVGGIKEKILAAKRANINKIILSEDNRKDIEEIKQDYLKGLTFYYTNEMMDVLEYALLK